MINSRNADKVPFVWIFTTSWYPLSVLNLEYFTYFAIIVTVKINKIKVKNTLSDPFLYWSKLDYKVTF